MLKKITFLLIIFTNYNSCGEKFTWFWNKCTNASTAAYEFVECFFVSKGKAEMAEAGLKVANQGIELATKTAPMLAVHAAGQPLDLTPVTQSVQKVEFSMNEGFQKVLEHMNAAQQREREAQAVLVAFLAITCGTCYVISSVKNWLFPSAEQKAAQLQAQQVLKLQELNTCLLTNEHGKKDANGLPCACNQVAQEFLKIAGQQRLNKIQKSFKEATQSN